MKKSRYSDRRRSVRIMGRVLFGWGRISTGHYERISADYDNGISLYSQESLAEIQSFIGAQNALSRLGEKDNDLADFLGHIDTKINLLLKKVSGEKTILDSLTMQNVSLSGGGLAFLANEKVEKGSYVECHVVLLPEYSHAYSVGKVVNCMPVAGENDKSCFRVSMEYSLIMEEDREKIIQHNFRQQSLSLRNKRQ